MKTLILTVIFLLLSVVVAEGSDTKKLCDTGLEYITTVTEAEGGNILSVMSPDQERIFIIAVDYNKDGTYEMMVFDTNGDTYVDMKFEGGQATLEQVLELFCTYIDFSMS